MENLKPFNLVATNQRFVGTLLKMSKPKVNAVGVNYYKNEHVFTQACQVIFYE